MHLGHYMGSTQMHLGHYIWGSTQMHLGQQMHYTEAQHRCIWGAGVLMTCSPEASLHSNQPNSSMRQWHILSQQREGDRSPCQPASQ